MKPKIIFILSCLFLLHGCNNKGIKNLESGHNQNYIQYKNEFDPLLVNHFPKGNISQENFVVSNTNEEKNDVGLFLFEYNLPNEQIDNLMRTISKKSISHYKSKDSCLLKINRFETLRTKDSVEIVKIKDTTLIDQPCYRNKLPIPNFIDYSSANKTDFWKENYDIYVLEAKAGNQFKEFELLPNIQMPAEWKNGYSKGIAIDKGKKTVIYWSVIW